jgi:hypothetical protein
VDRAGGGVTSPPARVCDACGERALVPFSDLGDIPAEILAA